MKCRACDFENIPGVDRCENCMEPFRDVDVPQPKEGLQAHIMMDAIREVYSPNPASISIHDSVMTAIETMRSRKAGCVLVLDGENLAGILTEVDLLFKTTPDEVHQARADSIMTRRPEVVQEDASMAYALQLMSVGGYRHLPVVRAGKPVGIVSVKDLLSYLYDHLI